MVPRNHSAGESCASTTQDSLKDVKSELLDALTWDGYLQATASSFAVSGKVEDFPLPNKLIVHGVGEMAIPITADGIAKLREVAKKAPGGNTPVRQGLVISATEVPVQENFWNMVRDVSHKAMADLGLPLAEGDIAFLFQNLLLYETDGHFQLHGHKGSQMFATLVIEVPVKDGHGGGLFVAKHKQTTKTLFPHERPPAFYYAAFLNDCEHHLIKVTPEATACLVFNLVLENFPTVSSKKLRSLSGFESRVLRVEAALSRLFNKNSMFGLRKVAIPLESKTCVDFESLKGQDRLKLELLSSCGSMAASVFEKLELHICLLAKHTVIYNNYELDTDYSTERWVSSGSSQVADAIDLSRMNIDVKSEVLLRDGGGKEPFGDTPDDKHTSTTSETNEFWYYQAVLVVWPRKKNAYMACLANFSKALAKVEGEEPHEATAFLKQILGALSDLVEEKKWTWKTGTGDRHKLLELCLKFGSRGEVLKALEVLRKLGEIGSLKESQVIARAVKLHGWSVVVNRLLCKAAKSDTYIHLCLELKKLECSDAASQVGRTILGLCTSCIDKLTVPIVLRLWEMVPQVLGESALAELLELLKSKASTELLCSLISKHESFEKIGVSKRDPAFQALFSMVKDRELLCPATVLQLLGTVIKAFDWLGNQELLDSFIATLVRQSNKSNAFKRSICDDNSDWRLIFSVKGLNHVIGKDDFWYICSLLEKCMEAGSPPVIQDATFISSFTRLCQLGVNSEPAHHLNNRILVVLRALCWLGEDIPLATFKQALAFLSRLDNHFAKRALEDDKLWASERESPVLVDLAQQRIAKLSQVKPPELTWSLENSCCPGHPRVESFLKYGDSYFRYTGRFSGIAEAREFAVEFNETRGGDVVATEGGVGHKAYCVLRKQTTSYDQKVEAYNEVQQEMETIKARLQNLRKRRRGQL